MSSKISPLGSLVHKYAKDHHITLYALAHRMKIIPDKLYRAIRLDSGVKTDFLAKLSALPDIDIHEIRLAANEHNKAHYARKVFLSQNQINTFFHSKKID